MWEREGNKRYYSSGLCILLFVKARWVFSSSVFYFVLWVCFFGRIEGSNWECFSMFPQNLAGIWLMGAGAQQRLLDM